MACMDSLDSIKPDNKGESEPRPLPRPPLTAPSPCCLADKKVLIPLTGSLYVPGRIADPENVLVDIGTGYFVEKVGLRTLLTFPPSDRSELTPSALQETKQAKALYNAKVLALKSNLATLQQQIEKKQDNFTACGEMMRVKMAQQQQAQAAGGTKDD